MYTFFLIVFNITSSTISNLIKNNSVFLLPVSVIDLPLLKRHARPLFEQNSLCTPSHQPVQSRNSRREFHRIILYQTVPFPFLQTFTLMSLNQETAILSVIPIQIRTSGDKPRSSADTTTRIIHWQTSNGLQDHFPTRGRRTASSAGHRVGGEMRALSCHLLLPVYCNSSRLNHVILLVAAEG